MSDSETKKKRGRKPKGGKIVPNAVLDDGDDINKQNVILHLKCSLKDLEQDASSIGMDNFNFKIPEYEAIAPSSNNTKDVWRKLKTLEHNLHANEIGGEYKRACFWCTCGYETQPVHIPKAFINHCTLSAKLKPPTNGGGLIDNGNSYHALEKCEGINKSYQVYGSFCSPECAAGYLMEERIDSSVRFERYQMLNHVYGNANGVYQNVKPAPNPRYLLDKFSGNLTIQEYRSLFKSDKMLYMADKPLTRIMPEYHEESFESSANNKVTPVNSSLAQKTKPKIQRAPQSKADILNDKFGIKA